MYNVLDIPAFKVYNYKAFNTSRCLPIQVHCINCQTMAITRLKSAMFMAYADSRTSIT